MGRSNHIIPKSQIFSASSCLRELGRQLFPGGTVAQRTKSLPHNAPPNQSIKESPLMILQRYAQLDESEDAGRDEGQSPM